MPIPASMTITKVDSDFTVACDGRSAMRLTQDEALWVTACFLRGEVHGYLKTAAEHEARAKALGPQDDGAATLIGQLGAKR